MEVANGHTYQYPDLMLAMIPTRFYVGTSCYRPAHSLRDFLIHYFQLVATNGFRVNCSCAV